MDAQGLEVARRFTDSAHVTYPTAVDRAQGLWELYGFNVIPNGFFVDERGILRFEKIGGFDVRDPEDREAIEKLLAAGTSGESASPHAAPGGRSVSEALREAEADFKRHPDSLDRRLTLAERRVEARQYGLAEQEFQEALGKNPKSARALMGLASVYLDRGEREKALTALKQAWKLEPENWVIRKQIWAVEHPEQFYPAINTDWQRDQIKKEDSGQK